LTWCISLSEVANDLIPVQFVYKWFAMHAWLHCDFLKPDSGFGVQHTNTSTEAAIGKLNLFPHCGEYLQEVTISALESI